MRNFYLTTLGTLRFDLPEGNVAGRTLPVGKPAALIAYLHIAGRDRPVSRETLADLLWTGVPASRARQSLRQSLWRLRSESGVAFVERGPDALQIGSCVQSDFAEFEAAVATGDASRMLALYRGPFLADVSLAGARAFDDWADGERSRLHRRFEAGLRVALEAMRSTRRWADALPVAFAARRLCADDHAIAHLALDVFARNGLEVEATALAVELGVEPPPIVPTASSPGTTPTALLLHLDLMRDADPAIAGNGVVADAGSAISVAVPRDERSAVTDALSTAMSDGTAGTPIPTTSVSLLPELEQSLVITQRSVMRGEATALRLVSPVATGRSTLLRHAVLDALARSIGVAFVGAAASASARELAVALIEAAVRLPGAIGVRTESAAMLVALAPRVAPEYPAAVPPRRRWRTEEVLAACLDLAEAIADAGPALLIIDDAHRLSSGTRRLLGHVAQQVRGGIGIVLAERAEGDPATPRDVAAMHRETAWRTIVAEAPSDGALRALAHASGLWSGFDADGTALGPGAASAGGVPASDAAALAALAHLTRRRPEAVRSTRDALTAVGAIAASATIGARPARPGGERAPPSAPAISWSELASNPSYWWERVKRHTPLAHRVLALQHAAAEPLPVRTLAALLQADHAVLHAEIEALARDGLLDWSLLGVHVVFPTLGDVALQSLTPSVRRALHRDLAEWTTNRLRDACKEGSMPDGRTLRAACSQVVNQLLRTEDATTIAGGLAELNALTLPAMPMAALGWLALGDTRLTESLRRETLARVPWRWRTPLQRLVRRYAPAAAIGASLVAASVLVAGGRDALHLEVVQQPYATVDYASSAGRAFTAIPPLRVRANNATPGRDTLELREVNGRLVVTNGARAVVDADGVARFDDAVFVPADPNESQIVDAPIELVVVGRDGARQRVDPFWLPEGDGFVAYKLTVSRVRVRAPARVERGVIHAPRGSVLRGIVGLRYDSRMAGATVWLARVPSWGDPRETSSDLYPVQTPGVSLANADTLGIELPAKPGRYRLWYAMRAEDGGGFIASATNWTLGAPVWDPHTGIQSLGDSVGAHAARQGWAMVPWRFVLRSDDPRHFFEPEGDPRCLPPDTAVPGTVRCLQPTALAVLEIVIE